MTITPSVQELLVRADEGELLDSDPGGTIRLFADTDQTGGLVTSHRSTFKQGFDGAPPHSHSHSAELFYVLDGKLDVLIGETVTTLETGDFLLVPPGLAHAFAATTEADADVLFAFVPGQTPRADYYRLLDQVHQGEASWQDINDTQDLYDNHYVDSPAWAGRNNT